jgi:GH15 family glucan-1,4-alpha-glucosidase
VGRIEDYAVIGDMHTAALVGRDGSIDWLCLPRFDSPACFAALLGTEDNGHWRISPRTGGICSRRRYRPDTLVLETEWDTDAGMVRVLDLMPTRDNAANVVRIVEGVSGRVAMESVLRLRFDYGEAVPWVRRLDGQLVTIAGPDAAWVTTDVPMYGRGMATHADFTVAAGERAHFVLTYHPSHLPTPVPVDANWALDETEAYWREWMESCTYVGEYDDAVRRSLLTLKSLTYYPTGGIVAAATTSLPEDIGGVRNWDYRYCWLRDATLTLAALLNSGFEEEARAWREWLLRAIAGRPDDLQIMYGLGGERRLVEYTLDHLPGYEGSRPVRVGNAAVKQLQLDVYGEVMDCLGLARQSRLGSDENSWRLQHALVDYLEGNWAQPDEGLWEIRGPRRQFTHSKVMTWVALDRAIQGVEFGLNGPLERWKALREEIHADVCRNAYDSERNTFTQYYGSRDLDAALLLIPSVGFLPPDDPRVIGTIAAIERELLVDGFVLRYPTRSSQGDNVDGLPGHEGAFLACSFWMADALHLIGRQREARDMFERLLAVRNDVGLLAEEYDPVEKRQLGNVPQAFSHLPLVNTAHDLSSGTNARQAQHATHEGETLSTR